MSTAPITRSTVVTARSDTRPGLTPSQGRRFSAEARRHYRAGTTSWLNWCDPGDGLDPHTRARANIGAWIFDEHENAARATRAVMVSAV